MNRAYHERRLEDAVVFGNALFAEHRTAQSRGLGLSNDLFNMAIIHEELGQPEKAIALYSESCWHVPDNDFTTLAKRSNNLAGVLTNIGAHEAAFQFYRQTRHIYKYYLGAEHPAYADSLYNMANIAADANQQEMALHLHDEALEIRRKTGNTDDVLHSLHSIAFIHEDMGEYEKAASYAEAALKMVQDKDHDYVSASKYLADLHEQLGHHDKALEMYKSLLKKISQTGCKRNDYLAILNRNAYLAGKTGNTEESLKLHEEAFNMYSSLTSLDLLQTDEKFYSNCLRNMAALNQSLGDLSQAEEYMLKSLKTQQPGDEQQLYDICFLIQLYLQEDTYDKAINMLVYALDNAGEPNHPSTEALIDTLMETLGHANDKKKLLDAMKDINNADKIQDIIDKWQGDKPTTDL